MGLWATRMLLRNVSQCHLKQSCSGLHSPGRSHFTLWYDSWVQTIYNDNNNNNNNNNDPISIISNIKQILTQMSRFLFVTSSIEIIYNNDDNNNNNNNNNKKKKKKKKKKKTALLGTTRILRKLLDSWRRRNDTKDLWPLDLVCLLHHEYGVGLVCVGQTVKRRPVGTFNANVQILAQYLQGVLEPLPFAIYWTHRGFCRASSSYL